MFRFGIEYRYFSKILYLSEKFQYCDNTDWEFVVLDHIPEPVSHAKTHCTSALLDKTENVSKKKERHNSVIIFLCLFVVHLLWVCLGQNVFADDRYS